MIYMNITNIYIYSFINLGYPLYDSKSHVPGRGQGVKLSKTLERLQNLLPHSKTFKL